MVEDELGQARGGEREVDEWAEMMNGVPPPRKKKRCARNFYFFHGRKMKKKQKTRGEGREGKAHTSLEGIAFPEN